MRYAMKCADFWKKLHPKYILIGLVRLYQIFVSPLLGPRCRFYPSCSHYAIEALQKKGLLKGSALAVWRILRCNPLSTGGYDPVK